MKNVVVAIFGPTSRCGEFCEVRHGDKLTIGLNIVFANGDDMCPVGKCPWCDGLRDRIRSRVGFDNAGSLSGRALFKELKNIAERVDQIGMKMLDEIQRGQEEQSESDR